MSSTFKPEHPQQFFAPGWHGEARTPVVDGKYYDRATGELRVATGGEYGGPPEVDIIIHSTHEGTTQCGFRAARPFPVGVLLYQMMRVVHDGKLEMDSLTATPYAIRLILAHKLTEKEFYEVTDKMVNGVWKQKE